MFSPLQHCDLQRGAVRAPLSGLSQLLDYLSGRSKSFRPHLLRHSARAACKWHWNPQNRSVCLFRHVPCSPVCMFCLLLTVALASGRAYLRLGRELQDTLKVPVPGKGFKRMVMASRDTILSMISVVIIIVQRLHILRTRHLRGLHIWLFPVRTKLWCVCSHQSVAVVPYIFWSGGGVEYHFWEHKIE